MMPGDTNRLVASTTSAPAGTRTFWPIAAAFEDYIAVLLDEMKSDDVPRFADRSR